MTQEIDELQNIHGHTLSPRRGVGRRLVWVLEAWPALISKLSLYPMDRGIAHLDGNTPSISVGSGVVPVHVRTHASSDATESMAMTARSSQRLYFLLPSVR